MTPVAGQGARLETAAAWLVGLLWFLPLAYALWTSVHPAAYAAHFVPSAPLTLVNFRKRSFSVDVRKPYRSNASSRT